jgi:hypothetical protein
MADTVLAGWNEGRTKGAILDFVKRLTTDGPEFVPPAERIATYDNDGPRAGCGIVADPEAHNPASRCVLKKNAFALGTARRWSRSRRTSRWRSAGSPTTLRAVRTRCVPGESGDLAGRTRTPIRR